MTFDLQLAVAGIAVGSVYALIAIGIVLIYKCSGVVNFAQGAFVMLGAYFTFALTRLGLAPRCRGDWCDAGDGAGRRC